MFLWNFLRTPKIIGFFTLFAVFFSALFASPCYAIDDVSYTLEPGFNGYLCHNEQANVPNCSDFDYLIFTPNNSSVSNYFSAQSFLNTTVNLRLPTFISSIYSVKNLIFFSVYNVPTGSVDSITATLTNTLPGTSCPPAPSGDLAISSNGTYDVSSYASATVDVPPEVIQGDYHNDLTSINLSIVRIGGIILVVYFFYCIYRLIIKNTGGQ